MALSEPVSLAVDDIAKLFSELSKFSLKGLLHDQEEDLTLVSTEVDTANKLLGSGTNSHYSRVHRALESIIAGSNETSSIEQEVIKVGDFCKKNLQNIKEFSARMNANETPRKIIGFSEENVRQFYSIGQDFIARNEYKTAIDIFWFVCALSPLEAEYWMALGKSNQLAEKYAEAIQAYSMSALINDENPNTYFHAAECSKALGDLAEASLAIDYAIGIAKEDEKWADLRKELEAFKREL